MINTIIFDLDGTLLDTMDTIANAINFALKIYGYSEKTKEEIQSYVGNGIKQAILKAIPEKIDEKKLESIIDCFRNYYMNNITIGTKPYDDIIEMLDYFKKQGFRLGVVSNKFDYAVKSLCEYYFNDFIEIAIGDSDNNPRKPNPQGVLSIINMFGSKPENAIYVGDSEVDIKTAKNANMPCISVLWGFKNKEFLVSQGGKFFADTPEDIIKIIEKKIYLS